MIYSTPFNLSMKLYDKYKNILLKNVPEDYQDDISCGFIIRTYSELSKFESGSYPLIQKYNKIDEYYLRTLSEELLSHKVSSYISNDSTRALTHIKNYVLQLEKENKKISPFSCNEIINIALYYYKQPRFYDEISSYRYALNYNFSSILDILFNISPRSRFYIYYICDKYEVFRPFEYIYWNDDCRDSSIELEETIKELKKIILFPVDLLVFFYLKFKTK